MQILRPTSRQGDLTALWPLCERWDLEWAGETIFRNEVGESAQAVLPRPGPLLVPGGAIRHPGRPTSCICYAPRYTLAMKFQRLAAGVVQAG